MDVSSSLIRSPFSAYRIAAGSVTTAKSPSRNAKTALVLSGRSSLLLRVRPANRGWCDRAADQADNCHQGQDVGQGLERERRLLRVLGQRPGEGAREAEEECCSHGAERLPHSEDECGKRDESPAYGHVLGGRRNKEEKKECAAERGEDARERH